MGLIRPSYMYLTWRWMIDSPPSPMCNPRGLQLARFNLSLHSWGDATHVSTCKPRQETDLHTWPTRMGPHGLWCYGLFHFNWSASARWMGQAVACKVQSHIILLWDDILHHVTVIWCCSSPTSLQWLLCLLCELVVNTRRSLQTVHVCGGASYCKNFQTRID